LFHRASASAWPEDKRLSAEHQTLYRLCSKVFTAHYKPLARAVRSSAFE
jgi:hypothetical protein